MSTPEPRFEVPPEYAEVYEQAYRRAYEEVQASLGGSPESGSEAPGADGRRFAGLVAQRAVRRTTSSSGHRADRGPGPGRRSLLLTVAVVLALIPVVAFVVGRLTADSSPTQTPVGANQTTGSQRNGGAVPATVRDVTTTCTAVSDGSAGSTEEYDVHNVLDGRSETAWRCEGLAVGQELTFTLAPGTRVVQLGLVPGYARGEQGSADDEYARNDRITHVAWYLGNGTVVQQEMSDDPENRSLRTTIVPPTRTGEVRLRIVAVTEGEENTTAISTVQILAAR